MPPPHVVDGGLAAPYVGSDQPWNGWRRQTHHQERREAVLADVCQRRTTECRDDGRYGVGVSDDEDRVARVSGNFRGDGTRMRRRVVGALNDDWLDMACRCERRGGLSGASEFSRDDDVHTRRLERGRQCRARACPAGDKSGSSAGCVAFSACRTRMTSVGAAGCADAGTTSAVNVTRSTRTTHLAHQAWPSPRPGPGRTHLPGAPSAPLKVLLFCLPVSISS